MYTINSSMYKPVVLQGNGFCLTVPAETVFGMVPQPNSSLTTAQETLLIPGYVMNWLVSEAGARQDTDTTVTADAVHQTHRLVVPTDTLPLVGSDDEPLTIQLPDRVGREEMELAVEFAVVHTHSPFTLSALELASPTSLKKLAERVTTDIDRRIVSDAFPVQQLCRLLMTANYLHCADLLTLTMLRVFELMDDDEGHGSMRDLFGNVLLGAWE